MERNQPGDLKQVYPGRGNHLEKRPRLNYVSCLTWKGLSEVGGQGRGGGISKSQGDTKLTNYGWSALDYANLILEPPLSAKAL